MTLDRTAPITVSFDAHRAFLAEAFRRAGLSATDASIAADVLATTDAWGVFTHGSKLLGGYLRRLRAGGLRAGGRPSIEREGDAWAVVDADSVLGMVSSTYAMEVAIDKAGSAGIGYVGVRNACHFGAAGYYAWLAARRGFIGLSMANDVPSVAAPGSRGAVTGSNPIAYGLPVRGADPIILDMSIATVAGGKVYAARQRGESIPEGWLIDATGRPTTDPNAFPGSSALTPAAGHKGYGLAILIEGLAGILSGAAVTWQIGNWMADDPTVPTDHGAAFLAIDAATISGDRPFEDRMAALVAEIHAAPRADDVDRLYVPGEIEWGRHRVALSSGIVLPPDVVGSLRDAAAVVGLDLESGSI